MQRKMKTSHAILRGIDTAKKYGLDLRQQTMDTSPIATANRLCQSAENLRRASSRAPAEMTLASRTQGPLHLHMN